MKRETPRLSVVLPVYNPGVYLFEALESLWAQTMVDFEVIAVDDGSSDGSAEALHQAAENEPRLRVFAQDHGGVTKALNTGLEHARGEFIARMDADDVCEPERFGQQLSWLNHHPSAVALGSGLTLIDSEGWRISENQYPTTHKQIMARLIRGRNAFSHPAIMMRAQALRQVGGYREAFAVAQDFDLWLRLSEVGELANFESPLLRYRLHACSVGATRHKEQRLAVSQALHDFAARTGTQIKAHDESPRPAKTLYHQQASWAKWALRSGELATARKHAAAVLRRRPWWPHLWLILWRSTRRA